MPQPLTIFLPGLLLLREADPLRDLGLGGILPGAELPDEREQLERVVAMDEVARVAAADEVEVALDR